jgi:hypothetical protein
VPATRRSPATIAAVKRIALVEDNDDNRALIDAILDGEYSLHEYVDGPSARAQRGGSPIARRTTSWSV